MLGARGIGQAHVVGHSTGGTLALQLAAAHPGIVRSMVLLEPALPYAADEPRSDAMRRAVTAAEQGDLARAYGHFPGSVCSPATWTS